MNLRKTQKRRPRPQAGRCRCSYVSGKPCQAAAIRGSLFCHSHQRCQKAPRSGAEPLFQPDRYNKNPLVQETHNCWAYAMDVLDPAQLTQCRDAVGNQRKGCDLLYHQPGGTKGLSGQLRDARSRTCKAVTRLMRADVPDLKRTTLKARCPRGSSKIAMVVHPGEDYHFYRQDPDGWWSHKDGANPVKRYDAEGKPIWDPRTAARDFRPRGSFLNYTDFCGYWCAPRRRTIRLARG